MPLIINRPRAAPMSDRGLDLYESPNVATIALLSAAPELHKHFVFEPCCGRNAITCVLRTAGIPVYASDIAETIMAALDMPRRTLWPELAVFANNPWKED